MKIAGLECGSQKQVLAINKALPGYPISLAFSLPTSTSTLFQTPPWLCGIVPYDDSEYADAADPHGITFRPMSTLASSSWFPCAEPSEGMVAFDYGYHMSILTLYFARGAKDLEESVLPALFRLAAIQPGLKKLYCCRDELDERIVLFLAG